MDREGINRLLEVTKVDLGYVDGEQRVFLNGDDVSGQIRTEEVSMAASAVSAQPEVRAFLLDLQRDLARKNDVVMDGRDIGTVVLLRDPHLPKLQDGQDFPGQSRDPV